MGTAAQPWGTQRPLVWLASMGIRPDETGLFVVPDAVLTPAVEAALDDLAWRAGYDWKTSGEAA